MCRAKIFQNIKIPNGSKINIDEWVYSAGLPDNCPVISCSRFEAIDSLLDLYNRKSDVAILDAKNWSTHEWRHFIAGLHSETSNHQMKSIDEKFNLTQSGNSEILAIWFEQSIRFGYEGIDAALEQFLIRIGRRKFLKTSLSTLAFATLPKISFAQSNPDVVAVSYTHLRAHET